MANMGINLQSLRYFEMVARYEHYTKAANELYITQSTLSKAIEGLEDELGVKLFERQGRNVRLTFPGRVLRDYVQRGINEIEKGLDRVRALASDESGTVRLAAVNTAGMKLLPQHMKGFRDIHPTVGLRYVQKPTYRILDDLLAGEADIGYCAEYELSETYSPISRELLTTSELCLIVPREHPLSSREFVEFGEMEDETWIGYTGDTGMATAILNTVRTQTESSKLHFSFFAADETAVLSLVRAGLGIGMITDNDFLSTEGVVKIRITKPCFFCNYYMAWNQEVQLSPAARAFRRYILSVL